MAYAYPVTFATGKTGAINSDVPLTDDQLKAQLDDYDAQDAQAVQQAQAQTAADAQAGRAASYLGAPLRAFVGPLAQTVRGLGEGAEIPSLIRGGNALQQGAASYLPVSPEYGEEFIPKVLGATAGLAGGVAPFLIPGVGEVAGPASLAAQAYDTGYQEAKAAGLPADAVRSAALENAAVQTPLMTAGGLVSRGLISGGIHDLPPFRSLAAGAVEAGAIGGASRYAENVMAANNGVDPNRKPMDAVLSTAGYTGLGAGVLGFPRALYRTAFVPPVTGTDEAPSAAAAPVAPATEPPEPVGPTPEEVAAAEKAKDASVASAVPVVASAAENAEANSSPLVAAALRVDAASTVAKSVSEPPAQPAVETSALSALPSPAPQPRNTSTPPAQEEPTPSSASVPLPSLVPVPQVGVAPEAAPVSALSETPSVAVPSGTQPPKIERISPSVQLVPPKSAPEPVRVEVSTPPPQTPTPVQSQGIPSPEAITAPEVSQLVPAIQATTHGSRTVGDYFTLPQEREEYIDEVSAMAPHPDEDNLLTKAQEFIFGPRRASTEQKVGGYDAVAGGDATGRVIHAATVKYLRNLREGKSGKKGFNAGEVGTILNNVIADFQKGASKRTANVSLDAPLSEGGTATLGDKVGDTPAEDGSHDERALAAQQTINALANGFMATKPKGVTRSLLDSALLKLAADEPMRTEEEKAYEQFQKYARAQKTTDIPRPGASNGDPVPLPASAPGNAAAQDAANGGGKPSASGADARPTGPGVAPEPAARGEATPASAADSGGAPGDKVTHGSALKAEHARDLDTAIDGVRSPLSSLGVPIQEGGTGFRSVAAEYDDAGNITFKVNRDGLANLIKSSPLLGDNAAAVREFIQHGVSEELVHAADLMLARDDWETAGKPGGFGDFLKNRNINLLDSIHQEISSLPEAARATAEGALLDGWNLYHDPDENTSVKSAAEAAQRAKKDTFFSFGNTNDLLQFLAENPEHVTSYMAETLRQFKQLRDSNLTTETGYINIVKTFQHFVERVLARLRQVAADPRSFSPALADAITRLEKAVADITGGTLEAGKPRETTPDVDESAIRRAYRDLVAQDGFKDVRISDLSKRSGVPADKLGAWIKEQAAQGRAVPTRGDESLASPEARAAAVTVRGEPHLQVRLNEGGILQAPSLRTAPVTEYDPERKFIRALTGIEPPKPTDEPLDLPSARERIGKAATEAKTVGGRLLGAAKRIGDLTPLTDKDVVLRNLSYREQMNDFYADQTHRAFVRAVPDLSAREAITVYNDVGGDRAALARAAATAKTSSQKARYERALKLTHDEQTVAGQLADLYRAKLDEGQRAGILGEGRENYINRIIKQPFLDLKGRAAAGIARFTRRFRFAEERKFPTISDVEQAGYEPETYDAAELAGIYTHSLGTALLTRKFVEDLKAAKSSDGRPIADVRGEAPKLKPGATDAEIQAAMAADRSDYVPNEKLGSLGNLALHPEAVQSNERSGSIANVLKSSAIQRYLNTPSNNPFGTLGKAALRGFQKAQNITKATMFDLSPFHFTTEGVHGTGHGINPFGKIVRFDPLNPVHIEALRAGVKLVPDIRGVRHFAAEFAGTEDSLVRKIPWIGGFAKALSDSLFHSYIPSLKLQTFEVAMKRNMARFKAKIDAGELTRQDVAALTADQVNDGYGHQNYTAMARNPTMQHVFRLAALAPDFLESRLKFSARAATGLTGGLAGREQLMAMAVLFASQYILARLWNKEIDGDYHWDQPFSLVRGNRSYTLRSVPEDIYKAVTDTGKFLSGRESPALRAGVQLLTGRNYRGERTTAAETAKETLTGAIPISLRELPGIRQLSETQRNSTVKWWESVLGAMGFHVGRVSPENEVYASANKFKAANGVREDSGVYPTSVYTPIKYALADNDIDRARSEIQALAGTGKSRQQLYESLRASISHPYTGSQESDRKFAATLRGSDAAAFRAAQSARLAMLVKARQLVSQLPLRPVVTAGN